MKQLWMIVSLLGGYATTVHAATTITTPAPNGENKKSKRQERREKKQQEERLKQQQEEIENHDMLDFATTKLDTLPSLTIKNSIDTPKKVSFYALPLVFTPEGISSFFNHSFNRDEYGKEFLPHNLSHLSQMICHAQEQGLSHEFTEGAIRLFYQKLKSAPYVSAPAFERFLDQTVPYLELQLAYKDLALMDEIKNTLIGSFKAQFSFLQEDPIGFFDHLSKELNETIHTQAISPERARNTLIKFFNSALDKAIWSPDDQLGTWHSFKKIGATIEYLHTIRVIPDRFDANDLYWSLVERYCYFLELVGTKLKLETLQAIKQDIMTSTPSWLMTEEQEAGITNKLEKLARVIAATETRVIAHNNGIFTETVFKRS